MLSFVDEINLSWPHDRQDMVDKTITKLLKTVYGICYLAILFYVKYLKCNTVVRE